MFRLLHSYHWNWGYEAGIAFGRPGVNVCFSYKRERRVIQHWRHGSRHDFIIGPLMVILDIDPTAFTTKVVHCRTCGRIWPAEIQSPMPQGDNWNQVTPDKVAHFRGSWEREVAKVVDGKIEYKRWHWIGPCCELNWSGFFDGDDDREGYDEDYDW